MIMSAAVDVQEGAPLSIMYGDLNDVGFDERQNALRNGHCFVCRCEKCVEEAP